MERIQNDWRLLENGNQIPAQLYADQPYIVKTDDGAWLCCVTTGAGGEGDSGQHISTCRSTDCGKSWSPPVPVEAPGDVENSYAVMLKAPSGRIFVFYNRNTDNVREIEDHERTYKITRVDCLGSFVFKYSDDHGKSWSKERYEIPFRMFDNDRQNIYGGKIRFFWNVGRAFAHNGEAFVPLIRVGEMGKGFYQQSEGSLLNSPNLFDVADPAEATWITLPDGDTGLRTPPGGGPISEEQSFVPLSDGSFYVTYRSIDGYPVESYSRDRGHTWDTPRYMLRGNGCRVKHPRAANFVWKCENGNYLYWFHNHGGPFVGRNWRIVYEDRNPSWLLAGVEADTPAGKVIHWGEPEVLFYHDDSMVRFSYPDLVEQDGRYFITETEKNLARVHEVPAEYLNKMWARVREKTVDHNAELLFESKGGETHETPPGFLPFCLRNHRAPNHCSILTRRGHSIEVEFAAVQPGLLLEGRESDGRGVALELDDRRRLILTLGDGCSECRMTSEEIPGLAPGDTLTVNIDGGPGIVTFVHNGRFLDGGDALQFGWKRFNPYLVNRPCVAPWRIGEAAAKLRIFNRVLMTAECK